MENLVKMKRRTFLKSAAATGAALGLGGTISDFSLSGLTAEAAENAEEKVFQSGCPRNCYSTCSMLSYVEDGVLKRVEGNPVSTYTNGHLCSKGNSYPNHVYSPDRIKTPMKQTGGRGSGEWEAISWDEAYSEIAKKILALKKEYGNTLPVCLNKYSGNGDVLHSAVEGFFKSIGYTTRAKGTPCWPAGIDAQTFDFGTAINNDPEDLVNSKYIILWGVNPAWTAVHSMYFVEEAKRRGAKLISIDPILTDTAAKADVHIQIKTSTDGALALGMAKYIMDEKYYDENWLTKHSLGYEKFFEYLKKEVTVKWAAEKTGLTEATIKKIAKAYATTKPAAIWIGYGLQRHANGGQNVRAIDALAAMTGNIGVSGGGANYATLVTGDFNYYTSSFLPPVGSTGIPSEGTQVDRDVNINNFAHDVLEANEPPVKMLYLACRNSVQQDPDTKAIKKAFESMDLVVTADLYMTETVAMSDIVLPAQTLFESPGVVTSYWHYWMTLNERAIEPLYQSKSDAEIAMGLSQKMNELEPGSCTFPTSGNLDEWLAQEFNQEILTAYGIGSWTELKAGPKKMINKQVAWADGVFKTPSAKYEFYSEEAKKFEHPALPEHLNEMKAPEGYSIRCISPHWKYSIHSQFQNLEWMNAVNDKPLIELHPELAKKYDIKPDDKVKIKNKTGETYAFASITKTVQKNVVVVYEAWFRNKGEKGENHTKFNINNTVKAIPSDMGSNATGMPGISFHDNFVKIEKM